MNHSNLWAPWRMAYLSDLTRRATDLRSGSRPGPGTGAGSFLEEYWDHPAHDVANHVVYRNRHGLLLLNRYPYANGHLLAALGDPRPRLMDYEPPQRAAFWRLVDLATCLMEKALNPQGINI